MAVCPFPANTFGDRFCLDSLPLPRRPDGYAVQMLDTDTLLDTLTGEFMPVRSASLKALFATFDAAFDAAAAWLTGQNMTATESRLAIVPAAYDQELGRHVLIYGVLCGRP
jgi:hypothetical protein